MAKQCPVCKEPGVTTLSVIAAVLDFPSKCSKCGSGVCIGTDTAGFFVICALLGFGVGMLVDNFVIGGLVALVFIIACLRLPLDAVDESPGQRRSFFRSARSKRDAGDRQE